MRGATLVLHRALGRIGLTKSGLVAAAKLLQASEIKNFRVVYVIRDPLEMVLSAYFYHLQTTEEAWALQNPSPFDRNILGSLHQPDSELHILSWIYSSAEKLSHASYQSVLRALPPSTGVFLEAARFHNVICHVVATAQELWSVPEYALVAQFEDLTSPEYRGAFKNILDFFGIRGGALYAAMDSVDKVHAKGISPAPRSWRTRASSYRYRANTSFSSKPDREREPAPYMKKQHCYGPNGTRLREVAEPCRDPSTEACWLARTGNLSAVEAFPSLNLGKKNKNKKKLPRDASEIERHAGVLHYGLG